MSTQRRTQHICDCCGERSIYGSEHTPPAKWTTANVRDFDGGGVAFMPDMLTPGSGRVPREARKLELEGSGRMTNVTDSQTNGITLLPCPFCGSTHIYETFESMDGYRNTEDTAVLFCNACKAIVKLEHNELEGVNETTRKVAREAWNTRAERTCHNINDPMKSGELGFKCSVCGHWDEWQQPNFCPNCGAKVVE